ncbi:unnamed protein product, partial [Brenthis ino]
MMQQIYQQEQSPSQESQGQQMVLCPVRVVYETQMLVQPGEQMQPNQTILINPQNPPPWIQNRPVQNQVYYVQQMPTNYMQTTQQHIDPNQLYIQNFAYQNIQPMYVQNPQEQIRPMQMVPSNVVHSIQNNMSSNLQNQRIVSNPPQMPQNMNTVQNIQNQNIPTHRQITPNQITHINELINNIRPQETNGQNVYRQPTPQIMHQDQKVQLHQTFTMVPNNMQTMHRLPQGYEQSIGNIRPKAQQNIANMQLIHQNTVSPNVQETRKVVTTVNKGNQHHIPTVPVKAPQNFRPIQPRTNQIRNSGPNLISVQSTNSMIQHTIPNTISINNVPRKILPNNVPISSSISISSNGKIEGNNIPMNRKRKSESPDEVHKKISINNHTDNPIIIKRIENVSNNVNCSDVGVNTSPIHKPDGRIIMNSLQITPLRPSNDKNTKIKEELAKPVRTNIPILEPQNVSGNNTVIPNVSVNNTVIPNSLPILPTEKDKLVRNTVYTQARGRVLNDKEICFENKKVNELENKQAIPSASKDIDQNQPIQMETNEIQKTTEVVNDSKIKKLDYKIIKEETKLNKTQSHSTTTDKLKEENKIDKIQLNSCNTDIKLKEESKPNKIEPNSTTTEIKLKEDRNYVLTHVLDGYVIQESNIAFPIRKPLKEKCLQNNTEEMDLKKEVKEEKETAIRNNSKILDISHLQIKEIEKMNADMDSERKNEDKENPFTNLKLSIVKSWTTDQLATHLNEYAWNETVSVLQEHELDGESLFLVSRGQLVTIGVSEEHADIICEFVKS